MVRRALRFVLLYVPRAFGLLLPVRRGSSVEWGEKVWKNIFDDKKLILLSVFLFWILLSIWIDGWGNVFFFLMVVGCKKISFVNFNFLFTFFMGICKNFRLINGFVTKLFI